VADLPVATPATPLIVRSVFLPITSCDASPDQLEKVAKPVVGADSNPDCKVLRPRTAPVIGLLQPGLGAAVRRNERVASCIASPDLRRPISTPGGPVRWRFICNPMTKPLHHWRTRPDLASKMYAACPAPTLAPSMRWFAASCGDPKSACQRTPVTVIVSTPRCQELKRKCLLGRP